MGGARSTGRYITLPERPMILAPRNAAAHIIAPPNLASPIFRALTGPRSRQMSNVMQRQSGAEQGKTCEVTRANVCGAPSKPDRKSVLEGTSVSDSVALGGRR